MQTLYRVDCEHAQRDEPGVTVYHPTLANAEICADAQTRRGYYCDIYPVRVPDELAFDLLTGVFQNAACDERAEVIDLLALGKVPS